MADAFSRALAESMLLPAAVILIGLVAALFFEAPRHLRRDATPYNSGASNPEGVPSTSGGPEPES